MIVAVPEDAGRAVTEKLSRVWRDFADRECGTYSPLYAAICSAVADDRDLLTVVASAPPRGQQPNVLLAAVHYLLLDGIPHPLADVYAGRSDPASAPALFRDVCLSYRDEVTRLLASRHTQTNEPGRAAVVALGLSVAADLLGEPIGLLDAGCSAGLNLLVDRYRLEYGPAGGLGPVESDVSISCALRGAASVPARLPAITERLGLDRTPVDLATPEDSRWLLACVWPDTGRLARTEAAMELTRRHPPTILAGDMVDDLDVAMDTFDSRRPIVVVTTSSCAYLSIEQRQAFLSVLERRARDQPIAWLSMEAPGVVGVLPGPLPAAVDPDADAGQRLSSVLGLVSFKSGAPLGRVLGLCHPHGRWLDWTDGSA
jgi:hypothetical protein